MVGTLIAQSPRTSEGVTSQSRKQKTAESHMVGTLIAQSPRTSEGVTSQSRKQKNCRISYGRHTDCPVTKDQ